ncbi:HAD-IA family hydrolase [Pacificimonas flava]|uniref:Phosphoglycolate phosphatase, clustered with ribosomal large subunit pseudouridine synthase C n=1 Tax=Pacificimonas flava TaxID=1234595 RepID=M2TKA9_9SPHN|nr:HAD-IA family hydrolase [Pacificimonas flava]EMD82121.1 phosphoglycolate phosphatase, clustered with ribosomal large subunit pseudouridine synthase C [Pacificimonas flava]MBB5280399.1 phosphoglycolate phosphatase [Pacificimonas flava]
MSIRLAIFDCDGTLMDSQANIVAAMDACFDMNRLPPPAANATRRIVGLSLPEAMAQLVPEAEAALHDKMAEDYKTCFKRMRAEAALAHEPLYEGVLETLVRLEEAGWLLGIATGKSDRGLELALDYHGLGGRFMTLQTADRHPSKPHPAMVLQALRDAGAEAEGALMIGDTIFDMAMGQNAGVRSLGVAWGYHAPEELTEAGAVAVLDDYSALGDYILTS